MVNQKEQNNLNYENHHEKLLNIDQFVLTTETETNLSINTSVVILKGHLSHKEIIDHLNGTLN